MMQTLRYLICRIILIISALVLSACGGSQTTPFVSTAITPDNPAISTSDALSLQPSRTPRATRTPKIDREALTPAPTPSLTPTLDLKNYNNSWVRFYDHIYGISIEYPLIYGEKPYQGICDPFETRAGIHFGENNEVFVRQRLGISLEDHILSFLLKYHPEEQFKLESQQSLQINNQPAIAIKYRFGEATEIRELVFVNVPEMKLIYTFSFIGGNACDVPEIGLSERTLFEHAVETFYVEK